MAYGGSLVRFPSCWTQWHDLTSVFLRKFHHGPSAEDEEEEGTPKARSSGTLPESKQLAAIGENRALPADQRAPAAAATDAHANGNSKSSGVSPAISDGQ